MNQHNTTLRVAVLGYGAIGIPVVESLHGGSIPGTEFIGVIVREGTAPGTGKAADAGYTELTIDEAVAQADLIVEAAGGDSVREFGPRIIASGTDFLVVSVGAIADPELRRTLCDEGPGRTYFSTGAIGGLDLLAAAAVDGGLDEVTLTSRKLPGSIVQPWMSVEATDALRQATEPVTVFDGPVTEAIKLFPKSLNIAVALAQATGLWEHTTVKLVGDPEATLTRHEIQGRGTSGEYSFTIYNHPLRQNPASSAIVAQALLKGVSALACPSGTLI